MTANIYTIPAGAPFLHTLARAMLDGDLPVTGGGKRGPLDLPSITLLLPTPRAVRAARDAFLEVAGARAMLMPIIRPISHGDEDAGFISSLADGKPSSAAEFDLPPPIPPVQRTLTLMQLIMRWRDAQTSDPDMWRTGQRNTPAQAANLAVELARLMDDVEREDVLLSNLETLIPAEFSEHWLQTVEFLKIVTEHWPALLSAYGMLSPQAHANARIIAEAERIAKLGDAAPPIIVAGVTGSIPATVGLMRAVAGKRNGAIVLPALDTDLDDESWNAITPRPPEFAGHPEHPQFALKKLLDRLGVRRGDVETIAAAKPDRGLQRRAGFFSEAMRPSTTTEKWRTYISRIGEGDVRAALEGVSLIEAPNALDEAEAVALILREAVETPGRTAALVSPDRVLARRVAVRLAAWGIRVDDSAGRPMAKTPPGALLTLAIEAIAADFAPAETMALLKHPLCRLGLAPFDVRRFARALEIAAFRTPYLGRGISGVAAALEKSESDRLEKKRQHRAAERLWDEDLAGALDIVRRLEAAYAPIAALYQIGGRVSLKALFAAHIATAEALAQHEAIAGSDEDAPHPLWQGAAGEAVSAILREFIDEDTPDIDIAAHGYSDLYASLTARENVQEYAAAHPRVSIWGRLESRLQQPDVVVLGSLNEGVWPETAEPGAWLNRPMRSAIGLPSPEEKIGHSAHDFSSLLGSRSVVLTRAEKISGVPAVPSRWLMRIDALLQGLGKADALAPAQPYLAWARARDSIDLKKRIQISAPEPRPPVDVRPRRLSVTAVETWISNPYATFAQHILKLSALPPLGQAPDQGLRGALAHEVMAQFAVKYPAALPPDVIGELRAIAAAVLYSYTGHPRVAAFWMPRLERFLVWFAEEEAKLRQGVLRVIAETKGTLVVPAPAGPFVLTARADRVDVNASGGAVITDYKTGGLPSQEAVVSGRSPQLPLEAAIALGDSGFAEVAGNPVSGLRYIRASGGEPPGEVLNIKAGAEELAGVAIASFAKLVAQYDDASTPYRAVRRAKFKYDYDAYAHLARVSEWSAREDEETDA